MSDKAKEIKTKKRTVPIRWGLRESDIISQISDRILCRRIMSDKDKVGELMFCKMGKSSMQC